MTITRHSLLRGRINQSSKNQILFDTRRSWNLVDFRRNISQPPRVDLPLPDRPSSITEYLNSKNFISFEGYSQQIQQQVHDLIQLTNAPNINVMEIGFNAGHSAEVFLKNNSKLTLTSFDLGLHDYVAPAKNYIDETYPNKHTLILGDSRTTIPNFFENNKHTKFDIIFIDGGHDYDIANADIINCAHLAHKDTIVILDDVVFKKEWKKGYTIGPTQTWTEQLEQNKIIELNRKCYCDGRGMTWGKYIL
jgi:predicted O-methyltransferase YrrM